MLFRRNKCEQKANLPHPRGVDEAARRQQASPDRFQCLLRWYDWSKRTNMRPFFPRILLLCSLWPASLANVTGQSYTFTTIAGVAGLSGTADGTNSEALFHRPAGLALDAAGNIYVADQLNYTIRKLTPAGTNWIVSTLAGLAGTNGFADGTNDQARFDLPSALAVDTAGNLFVTDYNNQTVRKLTPIGTNWVVSTVAGLARVFGSADGTNSEARFHGPRGIAGNGGDGLYVTDQLNYTVRGIKPADTNWVTSTLAGSAGNIYGRLVDGTNGDAEFNVPFGITRHSGGNLYVADFGNNAIRRIAPMGPDWVTTTVAGFSGNTGAKDGPASLAMFSSPNGIAVDASETLYVTDQYNYTIRKLTPIGTNWVVSTLAGQVLRAGSTDGTGTNALFYKPWGIVVDQAGNLFVADSVNNTIRKGTPASTPLPALQILLSANQVVLAWPMAASNFVLETARTLDPGASWIALTNGIAISGNNHFLTNEVGAGPAFFRLRSQ
jgi:streptogramin lyase